MSANLFRSVLLGLSLMAMLMMAVAAYGRYQSTASETEDTCLNTSACRNTELPWETLASQWFRTVSIK